MGAILNRLSAGRKRPLLRSQNLTFVRMPVCECEADIVDDDHRAGEAVAAKGAIVEMIGQGHGEGRLQPSHGEQFQFIFRRVLFGEVRFHKSSHGEGRSCKVVGANRGYSQW